MVALFPPALWEKLTERTKGYPHNVAIAIFFWGGGVCVCVLCLYKMLMLLFVQNRVLTKSNVPKYNHINMKLNIEVRLLNKKQSCTPNQLKGPVSPPEVCWSVPGAVKKIHHRSLPFTTV